jgi:hypothetical protein
VGFANLFPRFTVTRLCSVTVEMSNDSCWFCCKLAVLSGSAAALVVPATALCAGTLVAALLLTSLATGGAGAAAWFPLDVDAADADAEIAASPDAIIVTPGPAGAAAEPASRPAVVSVAELTLTVELLLLCTTCWAPGGAGPATTVMADAMVAIVLAEGLLPMEPSWKGCACGADMGNEPAGHMHAQLQPPFAAAAAVLFPPEPATTVTADAAADVVDAAISASGVSVPELTEADALEEDVAAAFAELFPEPPPPATTVMASAAAPAAVALEFEDPEPDPATTVTAAAAAPLIELVELFPLPASTVTAAGAAPFA